MSVCRYGPRYAQKSVRIAANYAQKSATCKDYLTVQKECKL